MHIGRELVQDECLEFGLLACIVNVNADQIAVNIIIKDYSVRDFPAFGTVSFGQVNIERIGIRVII